MVLYPLARMFGAIPGSILDYISYLRNIKKDTGRTINCKISALIKV